jgi:hypothetical protein
MLCQYSRRRLVSREKPETASEAAGERGDTLDIGTVTVVVCGYWPRAEPLKVSSRAAKVERILRSRTPARLYVYDTILAGLAQHL